LTPIDIYLCLPPLTPFFLCWVSNPGLKHAGQALYH
jgi:hypothetical protein